MEYCAGVWSSQEFESLDRVQIRSMRYFLGVNKYTPTHALYGDMAWVNMPKYRRWKSQLRLWNRLVEMENSRLTRRVFIWDSTLCPNNWSSDTFEILLESGMEEAYIYM